ncbi:hypothetical protein K8R43_03760 [archaeon]|nr:hypothetical protein [archaeon]
MDERLPSEQKRMTREEFIELVEAKAEASAQNARHSDGNLLTEDEKKNFKFLYRKRAEVFWNENGAPPKGAPIDLIFEPQEGKKAKIGLRVEDSEPPQEMQGVKTPDLMFLILLISFIALLTFAALMYVFFVYLK